MVASLLLVGCTALSAGGLNLRRLKSEARATRLDALRAAPSLSPSERKELDGLLRRGDTYRAAEHPAAHAAFKAEHNAVLVALARHCGGADARCFYLDGADGGTTAALRAAGFGTAQLLVANPYAETCDALEAPPHALAHVSRARAEDALREPPLAGALGSIAAFYFDGCSGLAAPLVAMVEAALGGATRERLAIGFTLTEAEPAGRSLPDREQAVHRACAAACRSRGYRLAHVGDEPERYGVCARARKKEGGTLTSWVVCTRRAGRRPA